MVWVFTALGKSEASPCDDPAGRLRALSSQRMRELVSSKAAVEYGVTLISAVKAAALLRRARSLVELAVRIVRLNG